MTVALFPTWIVDFCTFSGAFWWGLVVLSLLAFCVASVVARVRAWVQGRRPLADDPAGVIEAAERLTREAAQ